MPQQKEDEIIWCQNQIFTLQRFFTENVLAIEINKSEILMNKPVCLGLSKLILSKILMYVFEYDYAKTKYGENSRLYYMDTYKNRWHL